MSITDFVNKIKGIKDIDNFTHLYLIILIFVGISAFGLGRLSVPRGDLPDDNKNKEIEVKSGATMVKQENQIKNVSNSGEKKFLASKNGKLYYTVGCSGAKKIALKNIIWFSDSSEAELAGYKLSSSCNK